MKETIPSPLNSVMFIPEGILFFLKANQKLQIRATEVCGTFSLSDLHQDFELHSLLNQHDLTHFEHVVQYLIITDVIVVFNLNY